MLYLYRDITPNIGENLHFYFNSIQEYLDRLEQYKVVEVQETNSTFNSGTLQVKLPASQVQTITYVIHYVNEYDYTCFHVENITNQSNMTLLTLGVDMWGTYIARASFSETEITRTNVNIPVGTYDTVINTVERTVEQLSIPQYGYDTQLGVLAHVVFETDVSSSLFPNASAVSKLYYFLPSKEAENQVEAIRELIKQIGGIYAVKANIVTFNAYVLNAWLVPQTLLRTAGQTGVPIFKTKTDTFEGDLKPSFADITPAINIIDLPEINANPNFEYYVGTKLNGLKCVKNKVIKTFLTIETSESELTIKVNQGDKSVDITDAFKLGITTTNGNYTSLENMKNILKTGFGIASAFTADTSLELFAGATSSIANTYGNTANARYNAGGNGFATFFDITPLATIKLFPFVVVKYKSAYDETRRFQNYGFETSYFVDTPFDILTRGLLHGAYIPYIQCKTICDYVPINANDYITGELLRGVRLG